MDGWMLQKHDFLSQECWRPSPFEVLRVFFHLLRLWCSGVGFHMGEPSNDGHGKGWALKGWARCKWCRKHGSYKKWQWYKKMQKRYVFFKLILGWSSIVSTSSSGVSESTGILWGLSCWRGSTGRGHSWQILMAFFEDPNICGWSTYVCLYLFFHRLSPLFGRISFIVYKYL